MLILLLIALLALTFFLSKPVRRTVWNKPNGAEMGFSSPPDSRGPLTANRVRAQGVGPWTALPGSSRLPNVSGIPRG